MSYQVDLKFGGPLGSIGGMNPKAMGAIHLEGAAPPSGGDPFIQGIKAEVLKSIAAIVAEGDDLFGASADPDPIAASASSKLTAALKAHGLTARITQLMITL